MLRIILFRFRARHYFAHRTVTSALCALFLVTTLLWVVHPLYAGQRLSKMLSGDQMVILQKQAMSRRQLKTIHIALLQYASDYDGKLPALNSPEKLRTQLRPYRLSSAIMTDPFTKQAYGVNKGLAGKKLKEIADPTNILLFWSPRAMPDGSYLVLDASGRDRRVAASEYLRLRRTSHL